MYVLINFIGFHVVWLACVKGAALGYAWVGLVAFVLFATWQLTVSTSRARDLKLMLVIMPLGWLIDSGYVVLDLVRFVDAWPGPPLAPWWIAVMWANFALIPNHCIAWLQGRYALGAILGLIGASMAYWGAEKLGAINFPSGEVQALAVIGGAWFLVVPGIFWFNGKLKRAEAALDTHAKADAP